MSIPVLRDGKVRIIFGVGNKASDYDEADIQQLQIVANELHKILVQREDRDELRRTNERFRQLVETTSDMIWETDAKGRIAYVSPKVEEILGYKSREVEGHLPFDFMPPQEAQRMRGVLTGFARDRRSIVNIENVNVHQDGHSVVLETCGVPILSADGTLLGYRGINRDITARKRLEEERESALVKYRTLFDMLPIGITLADQEGRVVESNRVAEQLLGISPEEHRQRQIGGPEWRIVRSDGSPMPAEEFASVRAMREGRLIRDVEMGLVKSAEEITWITVTAAPVKLQDIGLIVAYSDLGHRKEAEAALKKSEEKLSLALEMAHAGYWEFDVPRDLFTFNDHFYNIFHTTAAAQGGYQMSSEEYMRRFCHPDDAAQVAAEIGSAIASTAGTHHQIEHRIVYADGGMGHISVKYFTERDGEGRIVRTYGVNQDVSERRKAEDQRVQLEAAVEQAAEALIITDVRGTIEYVNPAFEKITGFTRADAIGRNPRILNSGMHPREFYQQLWETIRQGVVWHGRFTNKSKDGRIFVEDAVISPIRDSSGTITNFVAAKRDISREQVLEQQLQQSQKMESIGRLAGGVAHDFNNMLSVILGYGEMILEQLHLDDPLVKEVREIIAAGNRSATLVRQLLAFSRKQMLKLQVLNLNTVTLNLEKMLKRLIGEDIALELDLASNLGAVMADPGQIEQVLMNLVVNARDAMPLGGKLGIETGEAELEDIYVPNFGELKAGAYVMLAVSDSGCGMEREILENIFEPFFTTKEKDKGTGLGLATVYGIVKQSGGGILVSSEVGKGTCFTIYLPRVEAVAAGKEEVRAAAPRANGEHILVVEDEQSLRLLVKEMLTRLGYRVTLAANGGEALLLVEEKKLAPDVLLTDIIMPGLSGVELTRRLRQSMPALRAVYMSGYTDNALVQRSTFDADIPLLQKPLTAAVLAQKLREVLQRGSAVVA